MSVKSGSPQQRGKVRPFGPNAELLCTLSEPRDGNSRVGAILWGLGVAEVKTARRLANKGIVALQVRINGPAFYDDARRNEVYCRSGVDYTKLAMDKLAAEHGVTSFILMGNCACANLCFHTAVRDPRVVGLILTNPYITKARLLRTVLWRKLTKRSAWRRLLTYIPARARTHLSPNLRAEHPTQEGAPEDGVARPATGQTIDLPRDIGRVLRSLCDRGVKVLLACTTSDDSFLYLEPRHGSELERLAAQGNLRFASVASSAHVFSTNDAAANLLNDAITGWVETFDMGVAASGGDRSLGLRARLPVASS
jgi:hypothetical protein